jgi:signal peptidase I
MMARAMPSVLVGRHPGRTLARAAVLVGVSIAVFGWILIPIRAQGISMQPTYEPGSLLFVNRLAFARRPPARGDIVGIRLAGPGVLYVKRIVALPGERVRIEGGQVLVNDTALDEPYVVNRSPSWLLPETTLGADEYFVIGDNRGMPIGQHELGTTKRGRIVGKVVF